MCLCKNMCVFVFQRVTASAPPASSLLKLWIQTTSTSLSTAPKSTGTWFSSSLESKGER